MVYWRHLRHPVVPHQRIRGQSVSVLRAGSGEWKGKVSGASCEVRGPSGGVGAEAAVSALDICRRIKGQMARKRNQREKREEVSQGQWGPNLQSVRCGLVRGRAAVGVQPPAPGTCFLRQAALALCMLSTRQAQWLSCLHVVHILPTLFTLNLDAYAWVATGCAAHRILHQAPPAALHHQVRAMKRTRIGGRERSQGEMGVGPRALYRFTFGWGPRRLTGPNGGGGKAWGVGAGT